MLRVETYPFVNVLLTYPLSCSVSSYTQIFPPAAETMETSNAAERWVVVACILRFEGRGKRIIDR